MCRPLISSYSREALCYRGVFPLWNLHPSGNNVGNVAGYVANGASSLPLWVGLFSSKTTEPKNTGDDD